MPALSMKVTTAGRAALVNADNTGTLPVLVAQIGVTATGFTANPFGSDAVLPGEFKRLTTFAGDTVAADTIHVILRDDSTDFYSLKGFALYLADGTLFALYGQAEEIMGKSAQSTLLLATDVQFTDIDAASLTFGDTSFLNPPATTTVQGVTQYATNPEALAGIAGNLSIVASALKHVLDSRFGMGAPSAFMKPLLNLTTAALLRSAIEIKGAALKDEGAGNGLDADLLDGQHGAYYRAWANLTGIPATFPPSAHATAWADITGVPVYATRWPAWGEVTGKPTTFTPAAHSHDATDIVTGTLAVARIPALPISQITNLQLTLDGKSPSGHTHTIANVTNLQAALDGKALQNLSNANGILPEVCLPGRLRANAAQVSDWNAALENGWYMAPDAANAPGANWCIGEVESHNSQWVTQTVRAFTTDSGSDSQLFRRDLNAGGWSAWVRLRMTEAELDARYGVRGTNVVFRDLTASRGDGTGVIFLNAAQDRYLYWDGAKYILNVGGLAVGGTVSAPKFSRSSSRRYKEAIETMSPERAADLLSLVRWTTYRLKSDGSRSVGSIAEELADGPLYFVVERNADGEPESINYDPLFALACAALNGLLARVSALEAKAV